MQLLKSLVLCGALCALQASASAQFSVTGNGLIIPLVGTGGVGGTWPTTPPSSPGFGTVQVPVPVTSINIIRVYGFHHDSIGDLQAVLTDPNGTSHNIFVRPGVGVGGSTTGNAGDVQLGVYTFIEMGGAQLPTDAGDTNISPGLYSQSFSTGGMTWPSGAAGILNTPMGAITGPAGVWALQFYDWKGNDVGAFTAWTLSGNGVSLNSGAPYCFGDGSGAVCPCSAYGASGEGCLNTSGRGAKLVGVGDADAVFDTFSLTVTGGPANKFGIFFQGSAQLNNPAGDGILCSNSDLRHNVSQLNSAGSVTTSNLSALALMGGTLNYQYWYRDPDNTCGMGGFNFTNGWVVTWN